MKTDYPLSYGEQRFVLRQRQGFVEKYYPEGVEIFPRIAKRLDLDVAQHENTFAVRKWIVRVRKKIPHTIY